jgi:hypothetical protein
MNPFIRWSSALFGLSLLAGCVSVPKAPSDVVAGAGVGYVVTEHSPALECFGALIDESGQPPLRVYVDHIADRTVPSRFRERRLSKGGEWLVHTALSKLRSRTVVATVDRAEARNPEVLVISGAWTQDDALVSGRSGALFGRSGDVGLDVGIRGRYDFIAADLLSTQGGVVRHASAIGLAVGEHDAGAALLIDSGGEKLRFGFSARQRDGAQHAQRRIAEAAVMVHLAQHFGIGYATCLGVGVAEPGRYREALADFEARSPRDRVIAMQRGLAEAGLLADPADGAWGPRSREALLRFQRAHRLPATGRPSPVAYALLRAPALQAPDVDSVPGTGGAPATN